MTGQSEAFNVALAPLRGWLTRTARTTADRVREEARRQAQSIMAEAQREAESIRAIAAADGAAAAESEVSLRSARVRRQAHETVLAAQEALRAELSRQVLAAVPALRADPRYPPLMERLARQAHALLGSEATVIEAPDGGIIAEAGSRRLDLSLTVLAAGVLESRIQEVRRLWIPQKPAGPEP